MFLCLHFDKNRVITSLKYCTLNSSIFSFIFLWSCPCLVIERLYVSLILKRQCSMSTTPNNKVRAFFHKQLITTSLIILHYSTRTWKEKYRLPCSCLLVNKSMVMTDKNLKNLHRWINVQLNVFCNSQRCYRVVLTFQSQ